MQNKIIKVSKVILGSFLISVPSVILPTGYGIKAAQAQTIQYQIKESINLDSNYQPFSPYEYCDLEQTISNFKLGISQENPPEWPSARDPLYEQMSEDLQAISKAIKEAGFMNTWSSISRSVSDAESQARKTAREAGRFIGLNFLESILFQIGVAGLSFLASQIDQGRVKKTLAILMNQAYAFGHAYYNLNQKDQSFGFFNVSAQAASQLENRLIAIRSYNQMASIAYNPEGYDFALQLYDSTLSISQEAGDGVEAGNALNKIGDIYQEKYEYEQALESFQIALERVQDPNQTRIPLEEDEERNLQLDEKVVKAEILTNLGEVYNQTEQYSEAINFSQQAFTLAKETSDQRIEGEALNNLGIAYRNQGNYPEALEAHKQALLIYQELSDSAQIAQTQTHLGRVYNNLGEYAVAARLHQDAIATAQAIDNIEIQASIFSNIGLFYSSLGQNDQALQYYQNTLVIAKEIENKFLEGQALNDIGNTYRKQQQYDQALTYHQQALEIAEESEFESLESGALRSIGRLQQEQGQFTEALQSFQIALIIQQELGNRIGEAATLANLGEIYTSLLSYDRAIEFLQQALSIYQEIGDKAGVGLILNLMASAYLKQGKYIEAEELLRKAIEVLEPLRTELSDIQKIALFETQTSVYSRLQKALVYQDKTEAALEIAERGRARPLTELLAERYGQSNLSLPSVENIKQIAKAQNATLVEYSIIYEQVKWEGRVQPKESELYIWVVKPTGEIEFRQTNLRPLWQQKTSLSGLVRSSRQSIGVYRQILQTSSDSNEDLVDESTAQQNLQKLHQLLIEPIAELLPSDADSPVIFIPQGELFLVPFPALKDADNQYLIRQHTILTAPAIQILELTQQQRQNVSGQDILIVGNPTMPTIPSETAPTIEATTAQLSDTRSEQLTALPGAEQEAREIARIFQTEPLLNDAATKAAVLNKMPSSRIIHLATHGLLDSFGFGIPGAIALAPDTTNRGDSTNNSGCSLNTKTPAEWIDVIHYLANPPQQLLNFNGFLTSKEIIELELSAELVVLSACSTGAGEITGDGVVGLSRAFIAAGTPSLIVSLWNVKDQPTAELMTTFYQNLKENPDKAQALRQAMLNLADKYPEQPQYWAAFTLIGEAE